MSTSTSKPTNVMIPGFTPTVLLVNDDPLQARVHRSILERQFRTVERATDAAEAFVLVEEPGFSNRVGLVVVGLDQPGLGGPAFVAELTQRLPAIPVLVLGRSGDIAALYSGLNVAFLPRAAGSRQILAVSRQMIERAQPQPA